MSIKILYLEDEISLSKVVSHTLKVKGFDVKHIDNGLNILSHIENFEPDICVFDVMLPEIDGYTIAQTVRMRYSNLPIIFLTAKSQTKDVLKGFESGANDYLKKPFSIEELIVRIHNQLKLVKNNKVLAQEPDVISIPTKKETIIGDFKFVPDRMELVHNDNIIKLTSREYQIMNYFLQNINRETDRRALMKEVWGDDSFFISRNLDVYIRKLREYFSKGKGVEIITLKGVGYFFSVT